MLDIQTQPLLPLPHIPLSTVIDTVKRHFGADILKYAAPWIELGISERLHPRCPLNFKHHAGLYVLSSLLQSVP